MWEPRVPLVLAERAVDFPAINDHIIRRRLTLEAVVRPTAARIALAMHTGFPAPLQQLARFERLFFLGLRETYLFGFRHAKREIAELRHSRGETPHLAEQPPETALEAARFLHVRARLASNDFASALFEHYQKVGNEP